MNNLEVGFVIEVSANNVIIQLRETSNPPFFYNDGIFYHGVSVGSFIGVLSGPYKIILRIEKEFIEDLSHDPTSQEFNSDRYVRKVVSKVIGSFLGEKMSYGLNRFPFIHDIAVLLADNETESILTGNEDSDLWTSYKFGQSLEAHVPIHVNWSNLFNTHLGIFGNTGSGKSNTLASLYTKLFDETENFLDFSDSKFLFIDFSGEYSYDNLLCKDKKILKLNTSGGGDKIAFSKKTFWNGEVLSILFSATEKTQKPFLNSVIKHFFNVDHNPSQLQHEIIEWIVRGFEDTFKANNNKESMPLLRYVIEFSTNFCPILSLPNFISDSIWHSKANTYYQHCMKSDKDIYWTNCQTDLPNFINDLKLSLEGFISDNLTISDRLLIACHIELLRGLARNDLQFDHINPLLNRIKDRKNMIDNIFEIVEETEIKENVIVISLRDCDLDTKKVIPLLIAIESYNHHKQKVKKSVKNTYHLIIDEAHNILSAQSNRETETWKDYRLEVFEEIIKEGRKFGYFLTIASQRPADISPTIVSQIHNFFIHRLVNENDLYMMTNTVSSLDTVTKQKIPSLGPGQCIILGTSFKFPILIQVDFLGDYAPKSETIDLKNLWGLPF